MSHGWVVLLQSFEHFEFMTTFLLVNESTDYGKLLLFGFYNNIDNFDVHFYWNSLENSECEKEKNCILTITSFPWSVFYSYWT